MLRACLHTSLYTYARTRQEFVKFIDDGVPSDAWSSAKLRKLMELQSTVATEFRKVCEKLRPRGSATDDPFTFLDDAAPPEEAMLVSRTDTVLTENIERAETWGS